MMLSQQRKQRTCVCVCLLCACVREISGFRGIVPNFISLSAVELKIANYRSGLVDIKRNGNKLV